MIRYYSQQPVVLYESQTGDCIVFVSDETMLYARWYEYWIKGYIAIGTPLPKLTLTVYPVYNDIVAENPIAQFSMTITDCNTGDYCIVLPLTICFENRVDKFELKFLVEDSPDSRIKKITRIAR